MVALKKPDDKGSALAKGENKDAKKKDNKAAETKTTAAKSRFAGIKSFFKGVQGELKKVHWPTRRETMVYTGVVLVTVVIIAILIWLLDSILSKGISLIIG